MSNTLIDLWGILYLSTEKDYEMTQQHNEIEVYLDAIDNILSLYDYESYDQTEQEYLQRIGELRTHLTNEKDFFTSIKCLVDLLSAISKVNEVGINVDRYDIVTSNAYEKIEEMVFDVIKK
jgi:hypothetical protein